MFHLEDIQFWETVVREIVEPFGLQANKYLINQVGSQDSSSFMIGSQKSTSFV